MTSKKNLVTATELMNYVKAQVAKGLTPTKEKCAKFFEGKEILDDIWKMASVTIPKSDSSGINKKQLSKPNSTLQQLIEVHLAKDPSMDIFTVSRLIGAKISKDTFNRARAGVGGVNPGQKKFFEAMLETAIALESRGESFEENLTPEMVVDCLGSPEYIRYFNSVKNSEYFCKRVYEKVPNRKALSSESTQGSTIKRAAPSGNYNLISTIILDPNCDVVIKLNNLNQKVIEIVKTIK